MRRAFLKFGHCMLIAALVISFGGHWVVLQSVAWTTMIVENARHSALSVAFEKTFDGKHPCALCTSIGKGRQNEKKQDAQVADGKLNLFCQTNAVTFRKPHDCWLLTAPDTFSQTLPHRPSVPPPRNFPV
jgi:hypothetical protein